MNTTILKNIFETQYKAERVLMYISLSSFVLLSFLYVYFLFSGVVHVVMNKESEVNIRKLHGEIASLEADYMEKQYSLSQTILEDEGYIMANNKVFIDRNNGTVVTKR